MRQRLSRQPVSRGWSRAAECRARGEVRSLTPETTRCSTRTESATVLDTTPHRLHRSRVLSPSTPRDSLGKVDGRHADHATNASNAGAGVERQADRPLRGDVPERRTEWVYADMVSKHDSQPHNRARLLTGHGSTTRRRSTLSYFRARVLFVDDEGASAAVDDLGSGLVLQGSQRVTNFHDATFRVPVGWDVVRGVEAVGERRQATRVIGPSQGSKPSWVTVHRVPRESASRSVSRHRWKA